MEDVRLDHSTRGAFLGDEDDAAVAKLYEALGKVQIG
jgi:hypothetical protein